MLPRLPSVILYSLAAIIVTRPATGQEIPRLAWDQLGEPYVAGLTPLYQDTGDACRRILAADQRWQVLPRPIHNVIARPNEPPVFEMRGPELYRFDQVALQTAARYSAEQSWPGGFRLIMNGDYVCHHDNELWLEKYQYFAGDHWKTIVPFPGTAPAQPLAWKTPGQWWMATSSGIYLFESGTLRRAEIPAWPTGGALGIVGDGTGRAVAWSTPAPDQTTTVAFYDRGKWTSTKARQIDRWTLAGMRPDGSVVFANRSQAVVVNPPTDEQKADLDEETGEHIDAGHFRVGDQWFKPSGHTGAVSSTGELLFYGIRVSDNRGGLIRSTESGGDFVEFTSSRFFPIFAGPEGRFLFLADRQLYDLQADATEPEVIAGPSELRRDDQLIGCDQAGRIYLKRDQAILVLQPNANPQPMRTAEILATHERYSSPRDRLSAQRAAFDTKGTLWYIDNEGRVMKKSPQTQPVLADDRLIAAATLWAGRDGAMLIVGPEGEATLIQTDASLKSTASLIELAETSFDAMLRTAPRNAQNPQINLRRDSFRETLVNEQHVAPWLAVRDSLWINTGNQIVRLKSAGKGKEIEKTTIGDGVFSMIGPLSDGSLLLAASEQGRLRRLDSWLAISKPDADAEPTPLKPTVERPDGSTGHVFRDVHGAWHLDTNGTFWVHTSYGTAGTFRIGSLGKWQSRQLGNPRFEHPAGTIWTLSSGYRMIAGEEPPRANRPTWREHLTPIGVQRGTVICQTPLGIAWLKVDPTRQDGDAITGRHRIDWGGVPTRCIGVGGDNLYMLVEEWGAEHLVSVDLTLGD